MGRQRSNASSFSRVAAEPSGHMQMQHRFSEVPSVSIPRSSFDRSHGLKTTFNAMQLIPVFVDEALPGDSFHLNATFLARMATPIKPVMDNMFLTSFFFFIPYRLIWSHWVNFCGEQVNPGDSIAFTIPQVASLSTGYVNSSIFDYMGLPTQIAHSFDHSALPLRSYNLVYNQWFRDENLQDSVTVTLADSGDLYTDFTILNRGKRHDYFTSCLPFLQKGSPVSIPLGATAAVVPDATTDMRPTFVDSGGHVAALNITDAVDGGTGLNVVGFGYTSPVDGSFIPWSDPKLVADLTTVTGATINALRQAFAVQQFLERDARGGTRYIEKVKAHFGVTSPDARLQRAEYLGGGMTRINMTPVAQTTPVISGSTPQGNLAGYSSTVANGHGFSKSFTEHGVVLGLVCVNADLTYQYGMEKQWSRLTEYDFYWPTFANLGEQAVLNQEIYLTGTSTDSEVFGYQERYAEYRYKPSKVTGQFRSNFATSLDLWHLADKYTSLPTLGATWISAAPPMARVEAVTDECDFIMDSHFSFKCTRPMPVYSVPGLTRL